MVDILAASAVLAEEASNKLPPVDTGNTAWLLISASLVLLMTPALALFYGGMSRSKSVLNMMIMSFGSMGVVGIIYVLWGYSMSFGDDVAGKGSAGIFADPFQYFGLDGLLPVAEGDDPSQLVNSLAPLSHVPAIVWVAFQLTFAVITVALISGAIAERVKFSAWLVFSGLWVTAAYFPLAHMVWGGGFLSNNENGLAAKLFGTTIVDSTDIYDVVTKISIAKVAPIDFAGGTVVHINAGMAGLVLALIIGKRLGFGKTAYRPHNLPFVMLGAALLWFGWFGFNAGSAGAANATAGLAWVNTSVATCAAILGWLVVEKIRDGHATTLGAASGVVAGLVAITPAAAALSPVGAIALGAIAGILSALAVSLKFKFGFDDSLDVVGVHLVAGLWGTIGIGFFATSGSVFYDGEFKLLAVQILVALFCLLFTGIITAIIALAIKYTIGWRVESDDESYGIDEKVHGETAYDLV